MVGMLNPRSRERLFSLVNSTKVAIDVPSKLNYLRQLKRGLPHENPELISEILGEIFDLVIDKFSPVRKLLTEIIGDIGVKHLELIPKIVPVLISVLDDEEPPVARQAIKCGMNLFRCVLVEVAIQGLYSSELNHSFQSAWASVQELKDRIYSTAFQLGSGGVKSLALKFVEAVILLYTADPNGSSEPPSDHETVPDFNISWVRKGHPMLNVGELSIEACQNLGLLLDLLRFPAVKSHSSLVVVVLVKSLSTIAEKRPAYFGRILPVLLGVDPSSSATKGVQFSGSRHVLLTGFLSCLKCTHPGAAPWKDRLTDALTELKSGKREDNALHQACSIGETGEDIKEIPVLIKEEKLDVSDSTDSSSGRKRPASEYHGDLVEEKGSSGKRVRRTDSVSCESSKESNQSIDTSNDKSSSLEPPTDKGVVDNGPVLQLVGMFGALVAQGEKAVSSLEILISSISADLLAEVVIATMCNLPLTSPLNKGDDELLLDVNIVGSDTQTRYPPSFLAGVHSLSSSFPPVASLLSDQPSVSNDIMAPDEDGYTTAVDAADLAIDCTEIIHGTQDQVQTPASSNVIFPGPQECIFTIPSDISDVEDLESEIPGLESSVHEYGLSETVFTSLASTDLEVASQEQVTCSGGTSPMDMLPSFSTDRSEEHSSKTAIMDSNSLVSSTATSVDLSSPFILPKMSAPVVNLSDEEKDQLQKQAFVRIIAAYKQIAVAGDLQLRFSLLAFLGVEFSLELDPWKQLQEHIFSDYVTHEGHELTLRVLYRLFRESEEERDFFSSTTATSVYEIFLLTVAESLRDSFPPSDKSLSKILGEAPYLPKAILKFLESLCCPGNCENADEFQTGDRVTQGLSIVWSLILSRPPLRNVCLKIALQSAAHHLEEVRMKAIRLVANKLYPMSSISQQIEDFANELLLSAINNDAKEKTDADGSVFQPCKESDIENNSTDHQSAGALNKDVTSEANQSRELESVPSLSMPEAQRCTSLYFALCTKKHALFRQIFVHYERASKIVKEVVQRHIPILVRTMGSSSDLLVIISDPPSGSENLLMQVLHALTDGNIPSPELISTVRKLFDSKLKDVELLIPVLPFLQRNEVMLVFPHFLNLPLDKFQSVLSCLIQGTSHSSPVLDPAEVLIAIHGIDPEKDGIPLKKITDACNACFEQRQIFTHQVIAKVLNQLVEQIPLPLLFMRTVLQAIGAFPSLVDFVMEILFRLVSKQIWKYPKLWVGFLKCIQSTKPQSFAVLLQLPPTQLENALNRIPALKAPLVSHASRPEIRNSLPRAALVVLGLVSDSQPPSQVQTTAMVETEEQGSSAEEPEAEKPEEEKPKESSSAS